MERIRPVDGLRSFAVLGVIWAHIWMFFQNIPLNVAGVDIHRIISFGGIGVDLFFVISGFCMYLMYAQKSGSFNFDFYKNFIAKRWLRIAPAFYFVVIVESVRYTVANGSFPFQSFLYHLLFINTAPHDNVMSPPYWSLAVEWHFYLLLPFLFLKDSTGKWLKWRVTILMVLCMLSRLWLYGSHELSRNNTVGSDMIWYRFIEFGFGILAARFYIDRKQLPFLLRGWHGFMIALVIAFAGRLFMVTEVFARFGPAAYIIRALAEPVLTLGFALMILNLVLTGSIFQRFVSLPVFVHIGKLSYSMYLWHWMISAWISFGLISLIGASAINMEIAFILSMVALIPVSTISYSGLESIYFKKRSRKIKEGLTT